MKLFVTVGTTKFDSLIESVDLNLTQNYDVTIQYSNGDYIPKNCKAFKFSDNVFEYYLNSDLVITHAGAGTIYKLLEKNIKFIVIPNLERVDKHQLEISKFIERNNFGIYARSLESIPELVFKSQTFDFQKYAKEAFFAKNVISSYL